VDAAVSDEGVREAARAPQDLRRGTDGIGRTNLFAKGVFNEKLLAVIRRLRSGVSFC
jgi:hypothetical protein